MDKTIKALAEQYAAACADEQRTLLRQLGKIPAPSHQEDKRAAFCRDWLLKQGAKEVFIDGAKNVICPIGCDEHEDIVVFAAHTDVVFPDLEALPQHEADGKLYGPGIGDDTACLVHLLLSARYLIQNAPRLRCGVLVVADSCEEGLGNLKGTRAVFDAYGSRIRDFISFDGYMPECCSCAVGSHRYKITCKTVGGHSYAAFGAPNAIALMSGLICDLYAVTPPAEAKTTYNVGRIEGGTTINSIAQECSVLYEFRSTSQKCLEEMEGHFHRILEKWKDQGGEFTVELLGVRPGNGALDEAALQALTDRSVDVIRTFTGGEPVFEPSSTDSNIPLSLGIPANTVGTVRGALAHTREEWIDLASLDDGLKIALSLMLGYAELT